MKDIDIKKSYLKDITLKELYGRKARLNFLQALKQEASKEELEYIYNNLVKYCNKDE